MKIYMFSLLEMNFFIVFAAKKRKFSFYFTVYTPMRASGVIANKTKQNMNVKASTVSA